MWRTETELDDLVKSFEAGTLPKDAWTHSAHLVIAGAYALRYDKTAAIDRLRVGIRHLNGFHGVENSDTGGYHESLTIFWSTMVRQFLHGHRSTHVSAGRCELVEAVVECYGSRRDLFRDYWSFDVVKSARARREWVSPDLKPLDC